MIDDYFRHSTIGLAAFGFGATMVLAACGGTQSATVAPTEPEQAEPETLSLTYVEFIRAPQQQVWTALTNGEHTPKFFHGTVVKSELQAGGEHRHWSGDGERLVIDGRIDAVTPGERLAFQFRFPEYDEAATSVEYRVEDVGDGTTKLTVAHEGFAGPTKTYRRVVDGWPPVISALKTLLESGDPLKVPSFSTAASKEPPPGHPQRRYVAYIRTEPEALWTALTDPAATVQYFHGYEVGSEFTEGAPIRYVKPDGTEMIRGQVQSAVPGDHLAFTFERVAAEAEEPSHVRYQIDDLGKGVSRLIVTHDFETATETYECVAAGWPPIMSGLKTYLESGAPLPIAMR